jgi:hypothetical protein
MVNAENSPAGSNTVVLVTVAGAFAGPRVNEEPLNVTVDPSRLTEYAIHVVPSVGIPTLLNDEARFTCSLA